MADSSPRIRNGIGGLPESSVLTERSERRLTQDTACSRRNGVFDSPRLFRSVSTSSRVTLKRIAKLDYITDGTPPNTIVVATLDDGTQIDIGCTVSRLEQDAQSPVCRVELVGQAPIRDRPVLISTNRRSSLLFDAVQDVRHTLSLFFAGAYDAEEALRIIGNELPSEEAIGA